VRGLDARGKDVGRDDRAEAPAGEHGPAEPERARDGDVVLGVLRGRVHVERAGLVATCVPAHVVAHLPHISVCVAHRRVRLGRTTYICVRTDSSARSRSNETVDPPRPTACHEQVLLYAYIRRRRTMYEDDMRLAGVALRLCEDARAVRGFYDLLLRLHGVKGTRQGQVRSLKEGREERMGL
jgi:hypothetical protein